MFHPTHPGLRVDNLIVDDKFRILGVIDWEFSDTVPPHAFLLPPWTTGYDIGSITSKLDLPPKFMDVLSPRKQLSPAHALLAQDWGIQDKFRLPMAYIFLDPSDPVFVFSRILFPTLFERSRDKVVSRFFEDPGNKELQSALVCRLRASGRYTRDLVDHNLFDDEEEIALQKGRERAVEAKRKLAESRRMEGGGEI